MFTMLILWEAPLNNTYTLNPIIILKTIKRMILTIFLSILMIILRGAHPKYCLLFISTEILTDVWRKQFLATKYCFSICSLTVNLRRRRARALHSLGWKLCRAVLNGACRALLTSLLKIRPTVLTSTISSPWTFKRHQWAPVNAILYATQRVWFTLSR